MHGGPPWGGFIAIPGFGNGIAGLIASPQLLCREHVKISADSPSVLIKPQVTDNCSAHLLWPI